MCVFACTGRNVYRRWFERSSCYGLNYIAVLLARPVRLFSHAVQFLVLETESKRNYGVVQADDITSIQYASASEKSPLFLAVMTTLASGIDSNSRAHHTVRSSSYAGLRSPTMTHLHVATLPHGDTATRRHKSARINKNNRRNKRTDEPPRDSLHEVEPQIHAPCQDTYDTFSRKKLDLGMAP